MHFLFKLLNCIKYYFVSGRFLCTLGLHKVDELHGIYCWGKCKRCHLEGMFF
jgi:hypothetical protein